MTASPVSLSFGVGGQDLTSTRNLTIANIGTAPETYTISIARTGSGPTPTVSLQSVQLDPGSTADIAVRFSAQALAPGEYEGTITVQGSRTNAPIHVPYWYGVPSGEPRFLTVVYTEDGQRGATVTDAVLFKISDAAGLPVTGIDPVVTAVSGGGSATVRSRNRVYPNVFGVNVRLGPRPGSQVFRIQAGNLTRDVTLVAK